VYKSFSEICSCGSYLIGLTVDGPDGSDSISHYVTVVPHFNDAPYKPSQPSGPNTGEISELLTYYTSTSDPDGDPMNIMMKWKKHDYYHQNEWTTLNTFNGVYNGTYNYPIPIINNWIWGDTKYIWSVNISDGYCWTNETYYYTTGGSRYDVNDNGIVNFQDAGLCWTYRD